MSDIAASAGVSKYTVSVVLNGARSNTRVSEETRQRITRVAQTLGYYPNAMAQGLMRRRINTVGVLFGPFAPSLILGNPYASGVLQGILGEACQWRCDVTLFSEPWDAGVAGESTREANSPGPAERSQEGRFRDGRTDGVILVAPLGGSDVVSRLVAAGVRLVTVAYPGEQFGVASVDVDNAAGIGCAVSHLVGLGHRRIAHLGGNENMVSTPTRRNAFVKAARQFGLEIAEEYLQSCEYNGNLVPEAMRRVMALPQPPTAILAGNDRMAVTAVMAAREMGLRIPEDLSIVGFDDQPAASLISPSLTTVRQPLLEIGEEAMRLLQATIEGKPVEARAHLLPPELVVRDSTGPPCLFPKLLTS